MAGEPSTEPPHDQAAAGGAALSRASNGPPFGGVGEAMLRHGYRGFVSR